ncbi:MAG: aspartate aminotransferase family protein, partial [Halobacteriota archaeon]
EIAPGSLNTAFFVNSGSEGNETAFKLARAYHQSTGNPTKTTVIGRWQSYHGATLGALSASGNTSRRKAYAPMLNEWPHIPPAYPYRWRYEGTPAEQAIAAAGELETAILQEGPETVAAFVAEPVSGASIPAARPDAAYYREIRRICDEYDVLFVADEVMCGFGRTGPMFAVERYGVVPDVLVLGKGLTGGYTPLSAVMVADHVADRFADAADASFAHGHTFSGNPLSAAIGAHVVDQYTPSVLETGRKRGRQLLEALEPLQAHPMVGDLRHAGSMIGIEFVADRETKRPFDPSVAVNERVYEAALDRGVYTYPGSGSVDGRAGDHLMLAPPLTIEERTVETIATAVLDSIDAVYEDLDV